MAAQPQDAESRIESEVRRIRGLIDRHAHAQALSVASALLEQAPQNRDVLYVVAVSQRQLGRIAAALATLERLQAAHADFARLYQERGHCYRATGDAGAAVAAYQRAVTLNPVLHASWRALAQLHAAAGRTQEAAAAARQVTVLARLPSCRSSQAASSSTRPNAACARRAPSRCASRSSGTASISGATSSPGSGN